MEFLSAVQVYDGLKRATCLVSLVEIKLDQIVEVPDQVGDILKDFTYLMLFRTSEDPTSTMQH